MRGNLFWCVALFMSFLVPWLSGCSKKGPFDFGGAPQLSGGADTAGGTDLPDLDSSDAWFLGDRVIQYCISVAPDFGVDKNTLASTVERSFDDWQHYLDAKSILKDGTARDNGMYLEFNHHYLGDCNNGGNRADLAFLFGIDTSDVLEVRHLLHRPIGFARQLDYDPVKMWGKGYIWLAKIGGVPVKGNAAFPDWNNPVHLHAEVLHELGHVLGNPHVPSTVMSANLGWEFVWDGDLPALPPLPLDQIDRYHELARCEARCPEVYRGNLGKRTLSFQSGGGVVYGEELNVFRFLMGREATGPIKASVEIDQINSYTLSVADQVEQKAFPIHTWGPVADYGGQPIFQMRKWGTTAGGTSSVGFWHELRGVPSEEEFGKIQVGTKELSIGLERNTDGFDVLPLQLRLLDGDNRTILFQATRIEE